MHRIILILILVLIIYYLYNQIHEDYVTIPSEYQDSVRNIYSLILNNQRVPINSIQVPNTIQQDINGTRLNVERNINANRLVTTNLKTNNLRTSTVTMEEANITKPIIVNDICDQNNNCLTQTNIKMLNLLENPILNRMYFSDASNCRIFNNLNLIRTTTQENTFKILGVTIGRNLVQDRESKPFFVNNKVGYTYEQQANTDASNNIGFTIQVPTPSQLGFVPSILWVEVYNKTILQIQISDGVGGSFTNQHVFNLNNYNLIAPDGNITQNLYTLDNQPVWIPMPFNYDTTKRLILSRAFTNTNTEGFKISGIAFSTNPWNNLIMHSLAIMYNTNKLSGDLRYNNPAMLTSSSTFNTEYVAWRDTSGPTNPSNIIVRIPVINSGVDKILYLVTHNDTWNENMKAVYIFQKPDVQPSIANNKDLTTVTPAETLSNPMIRLDNFTTTFSNPFSRHYNSSVYNRYIGTVIPSNLITSNFIIVGLQLPVAFNAAHTMGTRIKHIGTHDKIPKI